MDTASIDRSLSLHVLGSGSKGNASVISTPQGAILIDAGLSARETISRMRSVGIEPGFIAAVVVTHEHSDHICGLGPVSRKLEVPVYAGRSLRPTLCTRCGVEDVVAISAGDEFTVAGITVTPFGTAHDVAESFGFRFSTQDDAIGFATDTGHLSELALELLTDCRVLALESNHDVELLRTGPYPYRLKQRVSSAHGHLSNDQAADALEALVSDRLEHVIGMHLSETNNLPMLSARALSERLAGLCHPAQTSTASQRSPRAVGR